MVQGRLAWQCRQDDKSESLATAEKESPCEAPRSLGGQEPDDALGVEESRSCAKGYGKSSPDSATEPAADVG
jgi:hypothetical protein